jgi:hypothetical protein
MPTLDAGHGDLEAGVQPRLFDAPPRLDIRDPRSVPDERGIRARSSIEASLALVTR